MRMMLIAFASVVLIASIALADDPPVPAFATAPVSEELLRQLDNEQLRLLRRAIRGCPSAGKAIRSERDPCVTMGTDRAVADSGNADLVAFHNALRQSDRYDETRTSAAWHRWVPAN